MKKNYLSLSLFFLSMAAIGQKTHLDAPMAELGPAPSGNMPAVEEYGRSNSRAPLDTVFYENFANGLNGNSGFGPWTSVNHSTVCSWAHSFNGPQGQYSSTVGPINSTTKANGFMILDGDFCNPGSAAANVNASLETPVLNLSSKPFINLTFQHSLRWCCSPTSLKFEVQVSNNGGTTWTSYDVRQQVPVNVTSGTMTTSLNISAVAGGQSNVKIRFHKSGVSHYFWMIDDVLITEALANNMTMNKGYMDCEARYGDYYAVPFSDAGKASFRGAVSNNGATAQTNVTLNVKAERPGITEYNANSGGKTINAALNDTLQITTPLFEPMGKGPYTFTYTVSQSQVDDHQSDNVKVNTVTYNDSTYIRDNGVAGTSAIGPGSFTISTPTGGDFLGRVFTITNPQELNSMSVYVHTNTALNTKLRGVVYKNVGGFYTPVLYTNYYDVLNASHRDKWVTLNFTKDNQNEFMNAGDDLRVGIENYNVTSTNQVLLANDLTFNHDILSTFLLISGTWYTYSGAPFIRLNIESYQNPVTATFSSSGNCVNTPVNFSNNSLSTGGTIVSSNWDFGDGNTSTSPNPTHIYTSPGNYIVKLVVTDNNANKDSITKPIAIAEMPNTPAFPSGISARCMGAGTSAYTTSSTNTNTFSWTVNGTGNNISGTGATGTVSWSANYTGTAQVCVSSVNSCGTSAQMCTEVIVSPLPGVSLDPLPADTICINHPAFNLSGSPAGGTFTGNPGADPSVFNPALVGSGDYTITYSFTNTEGCTNTASRSIFVDPCTGIAELVNKKTIVVYPNPSKGNIVIERNSSEAVPAILVDLTGKIKWSSILISHRTDIDLSGLAPGMYFLQVKTNGKTEVHKVVIH